MNNSMLGSVVLDVAIGMAFVYLLLSLIASAVQEMFATFLQARAANLQRGIRSLLSEDKIDDSENTLAEIIYKHGLIRGLYQDLKHDFGGEIGELGRFDKFRIWLQKACGVAPPKPINGISNPMLLPAYIPSRAFALTMIDVLAKQGDSGPDTLQSIDNFLRAHHEEFQSNKAVEALITLVENSNGKLETFRANLENWYNDAMDRVSGWYKKSTQKILLVIGLLLAFSLNVDSVRVGRTLWLNQDLRKAMVDAAGNYSKASTAASTTTPPAQDKTDDSAAGIEASESKMRDAVKAFQTVSNTTLLPVGWDGIAGPDWDEKAGGLAWWRANIAAAFDWTFKETFSRKGLSTIIGWLITAIALSVGAPFWFDTLNKFMVVRSTIKPQEKSQPEGSKDKSPPAKS